MHLCVWVCVGYVWERESDRLHNIGSYFGKWINTANWIGWSKEISEKCSHVCMSRTMPGWFGSRSMLHVNTSKGYATLALACSRYRRVGAPYYQIWHLQGRSHVRVGSDGRLLLCNARSWIACWSHMNTIQPAMNLMPQDKWWIWQDLYEYQ